MSDGKYICMKCKCAGAKSLVPFKIVEDRDLRDTAEFIGASKLWDLMIDAKRKNSTEDQWYEILLNYNAFGKDLDAKNDLKRIFDEYINK